MMGLKVLLKLQKPGSVKLAIKQNANMITMTATASKFFELKSWDKLRIPKPIRNY